MSTVSSRALARFTSWEHAFVYARGPLHSSVPGLCRTASHCEGLGAWVVSRGSRMAVTFSPGYDWSPLHSTGFTILLLRRRLTKIVPPHQQPAHAATTVELCAHFFLYSCNRPINFSQKNKS